MRVGDMVKRVMMPELNKYGFEYARASAGVWFIERKSGNVTQTVGIQKHRFAKDNLTFFLDTDAFGSETIYPEDLGITKFNGAMAPFWKYESEKELTELLNKFVEIIVSVGTKALDEMSVEKENPVKKEMALAFYNDHKERCEKFMSQNGITPTGLNEKSVNEWFEIINSIWESMRAKPYEECQEQLIDIACFLTEMLDRYIGGVWEFNDWDDTYFIELNLKQINSEFAGLEAVVYGYLENGISWTKDTFTRIIKRYEEDL